MLEHSTMSTCVKDADIRQTARSKNRPSRKRQAGRKGTVDEYDYLVASIGRLVKRVDDKSGRSLCARDADAQPRRCPSCARSRPRRTAISRLTCRRLS